MAENSTIDRPFAKAFVAVSMRFGREFGSPLPKRLLTIGSETDGFRVRLNPTSETIGGVAPMRMHVTLHGCPAGVIDPYGGSLIADGDEPIEDRLILWAEWKT